MELITTDLLRLKIISLYEYDYSIVRKFEEEYYEMQFHANYFYEFNHILAPDLRIDSITYKTEMEMPLICTAEDKKILQTDLWKIQSNRQFIF